MSELSKVSFASPALPILMAAWELTRRGVRVRLPFDEYSHAELHPRRRRVLAGFVLAGNLLPAIVLAAAVLLVAGPRKAVDGGRDKGLTNINICLDISGSMLSPFGAGEGRTRYDAAMDAVSDFTSHRKGDAFGLTLFGSEVLHWVPLTKDTDAIRRATPFVRPNLMPRQFGGTLIGYALTRCRALLSRSEQGDRMIILVTDGYSGDIVGMRGEELAQELREDRIVVYSICVTDGAAPEALYTISGITGGEVFSAGDPAALDAVFKRIDSMQSAKLRPPGQAYEDFFAPVAWTGLAAGVLHVLALLGLRFTPW
jgi:Ca-activated chloride channel family protein